MGYLFLGLGLLAFLLAALACLLSEPDKEPVKYLNRYYRRIRLKAIEKKNRRKQELIDQHNVLVKQIKEKSEKLVHLKRKQGANNVE